MTLATARLLVGRTIVAFDPRPFEDCNVMGRRIRICYDPVITLDNGAQVTFSVDETDQGDCYGIRPYYHPRAKS